MDVRWKTFMPLLGCAHNLQAKTILLLVFLCWEVGVWGQSSPRSVVIPRGTRLEVNLLQGLSTKHSQEGEQFLAVLERELSIDGLPVLPKNTRLVGTVSRVKRPGRFRGKAELSLGFDFIRFPDGREEPVVATISGIQSTGDENRRISPEGEILGRDSAGRDAGMVISGGAAGAGIGAIAGGGKGAAIGSAAGGLLGLAGVLWSRGEEIQLPARTVLEIILEKPMTIILVPMPTTGDRPPWR
jgi:type IV secretion system protein VirB10